jgi:DNA (cytosine-5)-methyltransferase 1
MGYHKAGFEVVGVDINPQPHYPFEFAQCDGLTFLDNMSEADHGIYGVFDAVHASPPCQHYSTMGQRYAATQAAHPDLISPIRDLLAGTGLPYVIENVMGARRELQAPVRVCGAALGLGVGRHRLFECNFATLATPCQCDRTQLPVYGKLDGRRVWTRADGTELRSARTLKQASEAMGIDWMPWAELTQAIPPAYTEHIGYYLMLEVQARAKATA